MARATPGYSDRAESASAAKRIIVVRLERTGETHKLAAANLPIDQRAVVLREVKVSFDAIMASGDGLLSASVVVWLARRLNGERSLSWQQFQRQWPQDLDEDDLGLWLEDPQGRRLDDDGNVADTGEPADEADADSLAEVTDPQS